MDATIVCALIAALAGLINTWLTVRSKQDMQTAEEKAERERRAAEDRAKVRAEESRLNMKMSSAACDGLIVVMKKLTGQHTNGDVEESMNALVEARENYHEFCEEAAKGVAKV